MTRAAAAAAAAAGGDGNVSAGAAAKVQNFVVTRRWRRRTTDWAYERRHRELGLIGERWRERPPVSVRMQAVACVRAMRAVC